jgi:hypothetical protein
MGTTKHPKTILERKPQVGYQSHLIDKINDLAAASPYRSRNDFLDATIQILDDLTRYTLENELNGLFGRYEILLLASILKSQEIEFYPSTRYKSLVIFKVSQVLEHGKIDQEWQIDDESLIAILENLTEFQAYTLLITIINAFQNPALAEKALFSAFNPKDYGLLILARSSHSLYKMDLMAGKDPEAGNYILGKKYTMEDAENLIEYFEERDHATGLFKENQYVILDIEG